MSLINDMLRDLDRGRRSPPDAGGGDGRALLGQTGLDRRSPWLPSALAGVAVFALLAAGFWFYPLGSPAVRETAAEPATTEPETASMPSPEEAPSAAPVAATETRALDDHVLEDSVVEAPGEEPAPETVDSAQFRELIASAQQALEQDRLTSPIETSAYAYYQRAARLQPNHPAVDRGLDAIAERYLALAGDLLDEADPQRAQVMLSRAALVRADHPGIAPLARRAERVDRAPPATAAAPSPEDAPAEPTAALVSESQEETRQETREETQEETREADRGTVDIQRSPQWLDRRAAERAEKLLARGEAETARRQLAAFVDGAEQPARSAALLVGIYLQQGDSRAAGLLLEEADYLPLVEQSYLRARLLVAREQPEQALALLEQHLPEAEDHEPYRALLAGLYHRLGRYPESATSYRRLLARFGQTPGYWLGLALALDAREDHLSALEAYRRANQPGGHEPEVARYIDQRIATLSRRTGG